MGVVAPRRHSAADPDQAGPTRGVVMGAAGRDCHNFNVVCRDDPAYHVVGFTAAHARAAAASGHELAVTHDLRRMRFAPGSMGLKVEAACRFVAAGGAFAATSALTDLPAVLRGDTGTRVTACPPPAEVARADGNERRPRWRHGHAGRSLLADDGL